MSGDKTRVGCAIILRNVENSNQILLSRRSSNKHKYPGHWELPGGALEDSEYPEDCIRREIQEELSSSIQNLELLYTDLSYYDDCRYIVFVYHGDVDPRPIVMCSYEISEIQFHEINDLIPSPLFPRVKEEVEFYIHVMNGLGGPFGLRRKIK